MKKEHWVLKLPKNKPDYLLAFQWKRLKKSGMSGLKHVCKIPQYENYRGSFELFLTSDDYQYLIKTDHLKKEYSWGKCSRKPPVVFSPKRITKCKSCGRVIKNDEKIFMGLCRDCFTPIQGRSSYQTDHISGIHGLRIGIEIEIDDPDVDYYGEDDDGWGDIPQIHGWKNKYDGSLEYGREYVSPICTPSQLKADLKEFAKGLPSWELDNGLAGIHIHVNKSGYLSKIDVKKLLKMFYAVSDYAIENVFGRGYGSYNYSINDPWRETHHGAIINTDGSTVEFRGFAARHNVGWYLYCVDTVVSMCEYVRHTGYSTVSWDGWIEWNKTFKYKYGRK